MAITIDFAKKYADLTYVARSLPLQRTMFRKW